MLQGPLSPLFRQMADALEVRGVAVTRVNICPGDKAAWGLKRARSFRGRLRDFPDYVDRLMDEIGADAVVMHSERRPYHLEAAEVARSRGAAVIVTELGYLRPDFMTIELNGNSVDSLFPIDPHALRTLGHAPELAEGLVYPREAGLETFDDLKNSLPNVFLWFLYPHYRQHGLYHPFVAYARFLWREAQVGRRNRAAAAVRARVSRPFVFAMQTDTDFQIRSNAHYADMREALIEVFSSFAAHAPADAVLVVKKHPGDLGPVHWADEVPRLAADAGVAERVAFADGLGMDAWMADARGLITVNSSAGVDGLAAGVPVISLAPSIYDAPGLTFQGPLDRFWTEGTAPDAALFSAWRRGLAAAIQVRGTIYSRAGTRAAAEAMAERIATGSVGVPGATAMPPPRYEKARALGIR